MSQSKSISRKKSKNSALNKVSTLVENIKVVEESKQDVEMEEDVSHTISKQLFDNPLNTNDDMEVTPTSCRFCLMTSSFSRYLSIKLTVKYRVSGYNLNFN
jgi:hypothetical protein